MSIANLLMSNKYDVKFNTCSSEANINSSSTTTGTNKTTGGLSCTGNLWVGGTINSGGGGGSISPFSYSVGGALVSVQLTGNFEVETVGSMQLVTMYINDLVATNSGTGATIYTGAGSVPVEYRPISTDVYLLTTIVNGGSNGWGLVRIQTDGTIQIYNNAGNFGTSSTNGIHRCVLQYIL